MRKFFLWCAGTDQELLGFCPEREKIKHMGYGMLVLIPAILAFVSMSFALSTIEEIKNQPIIYFAGGLIWSLIIFSFDRFIVSTHRRKRNDSEEIKTPSFFLRLAFAILLGIVISHPLVMLYFNGSIEDQIEKNKVNHQTEIANKFEQKILLIDNQLAAMDSLILEKENERNKQANIVAKEIDGEVVRNRHGEMETTGLAGKGPSAENKINHLTLLQNELQQLKTEQAETKSRLNKNRADLEFRKDSTIQAYTISSDYLRKELALEQLKDEHSIVSLTQWLLIILFIIIDILPLIFKTFAPFGMYDKILWDDDQLLHQTDTESRKIYLQKLYNEINELS